MVSALYIFWTLSPLCYICYKHLPPPCALSSWGSGDPSFPFHSVSAAQMFRVWCQVGGRGPPPRTPPSRGDAGQGRAWCSGEASPAGAGLEEGDPVTQTRAVGFLPGSGWQAGCPREGLGAAAPTWPGFCSGARRRGCLCGVSTGYGQGSEVHILLGSTLWMPGPRLPRAPPPGR